MAKAVAMSPSSTNNLVNRTCSFDSGLPVPCRSTTTMAEKPTKAIGQRRQRVEIARALQFHDRCLSAPYGFIPAGATTEDVSPISSSALRTRPEAFASSTKALT